MKKSPSKLDQLARALIELEAAKQKSTSGTEAAALRVLQKLGEALGKVLGKAGFDALLSRALHVATAKAPWLAGLKVTAAGGLQRVGSEESGGSMLAGGETRLIAELLGLLAAFIGDALMLRLVQEQWPRARLAQEGEPWK